VDQRWSLSTAANVIDVFVQPEKMATINGRLFLQKMTGCQSLAARRILFRIVYQQHFLASVDHAEELKKSPLKLG